MTENWTIDNKKNLFNYNKFLKSLVNFSDKDKDNLDNETKKLLSKCIDPAIKYQRPFRKTGLTIGYIQSGKTSSMEALANKETI